MGKVDQGFVVLWASRHLYGGSLSYMGFGGKGLQVRDILHVDDLYKLLLFQVQEKPKESVYNIGGGLRVSVSLKEATAHCASRADASNLDLASTLQVGSVPHTRAADIPWYVSDCSRACEEWGWSPQKSVDDIFDDIFDWLLEYKDQLYPILGPKQGA